jgi:aldehyde dehydrogenase (NAD+)
MNINVKVTSAKGVFVNNKWQVSRSGRAIPIVAPADGQAFAEIAAGNDQDIDLAVKAARRAVEEGAWGRMTATERGRLLSRLANLIESHSEELAKLEATDTGKPMKQAKADVVAVARYFEYYGAAADKVHGDTIPFLDGYFVTTVYEPLGVTGHIIPWNYPGQMFSRTVVPALAMGNAAVVKPAEEACLVPLRIAELAVEVGFPEGALNIVPGLRHTCTNGGRKKPYRLHSRTWWEVAPGRFCGCRSRCRARVCFWRNHPKCRTNVFGWITRPRRAQDLGQIPG